MMAYLGEANVGGLLTEALTADVELVLADETSLVSADATKTEVLAGLSRIACICVEALEVNEVAMVERRAMRNR